MVGDMISFVPDVLLAVSFSVRNLNPIYFLPLVVLLVLLVERELIRSSGAAWARPAVRILDLASLPLLVAFLVLLGLRLNYIFAS
jgi:hypothetical protein